MKSINLNSFIYVRLTDDGKHIYYHQCDEINKQYGKEVVKPEWPEVDENGFTRFQLWEFIELYGPFTHMAWPSPIEDLCIYMSEEDIADVVEVK